MRVPAKRTRSFLGCALAAALGLFVLTLRADVFWRMSRHGDEVIQRLGGVRAYATDVRVNGTSGTLSAYAVGRPANEVRAELARLADIKSRGAASQGAMVALVENNRLRRYLVLPAASDDAACVVLAIDQPQTSGARPAPAWPEGLPAVAGDLIFSAVCAATRTSFATAETASAPEDAVREAAQNLNSAGWVQVSPAAPAFRMFASGRKICLLCASRAEAGNKTVISVLQREGATP